MGNVILPQIKVQDTPERYCGQEEQLVRELFEFLKEFDDLEREFSPRGEEFFQKAKAGLLTKEEINRIHDEIWSEYHKRCLQTAEKKCSEKMLEKWDGWGRGIGTRPQYEYVITGCKECIFTRKRADRATVEVVYAITPTMDGRDFFVLIREKGLWKVNSRKSWEPYDLAWHRNCI